MKLRQHPFSIFANVPLSNIERDRLRTAERRAQVAEARAEAVEAELAELQRAKKERERRRLAAERAQRDYAKLLGWIRDGTIPVPARGSSASPSSENQTLVAARAIVEAARVARAGGHVIPLPPAGSLAAQILAAGRKRRGEE